MELVYAALGFLLIIVVVVMVVALKQEPECSQCGSIKTNYLGTQEGNLLYRCPRCAHVTERRGFWTSWF